MIVKKNSIFKALFITILCASMSIVSAQSADADRLVLNIFIPENLQLPQEAQSLLESKMQQIATHYGMGGKQLNPRFVLTTHISTLTKDIIAGPPNMVAQKGEIRFFIGDGINNVSFSTISIPFKGVSTNENKALIEGFKNIKTKSNELENFIKEGKEKMISYYESQCEFILKTAETAARQNNYDKAIYELTAVPTVSKMCFTQCQNSLSIYFQQKIDFECQQKITQAKALWAASQNATQAKEISSILMSIHPASSCIEESKNLLKTIQSKIAADEQAAWNFKMRQYEDQIKRENELIQAAKEDALRQHELSRLRIGAFEKIATEFAKNLPKAITYNSYKKINWW